MGKIYDKIYDFNWLVQDVDKSIVIALFDGDKQVGIYQAVDILSSDNEKVEIKFANVNDLDKFLNYAVIRFYDIMNRLNVLDIPIRNLKKLYENSNILGEEGTNKKIDVREVANLTVVDGKNESDKYSIEAVCFSEVSQELKKIMDIASEYPFMDSQKKFDALASINLTNYHVEKEHGSK